MFLLHKHGFMCIIFTCLSFVVAETIKERILTARSSDSPTIRYSSSYSQDNRNGIEFEYVRELIVSQRWKSMQTNAIKILGAMYNESMLFSSQTDKNLDLSATCKNDLITMLTGIKEFRNWAVQMLDSFGKIPIGFERGTFNALGDFDQCLDVVAPGHFQGQYCTVDLILPLPKRQPFVTSDTEIIEVMNAVKQDGFFRFFGKYGRLFYHLNPRIAICVPSTCSKDELQKIANNAVQTMDLSFGLKIPNCEVLNNEVKFDSSEIAILIILGILIILAVTATAVDVYLISIYKEEENGRNNLSLSTKYLLCFSLYANVKLLLKLDTATVTLDFVHGVRVLIALWFIMCHLCYFQNFNVAGSLIPLYNSLSNISFQFISNGILGVQVFFFMSGMFHAIHILKMKEKINIKWHILRRIWRLGPPFMLVTACVILLPHVGSGPVWKETMEGLLADKCRERWWTNLLFINIFLQRDDLCLQWLWYISADFQLYVLSLIILIPMKNNPTLGLTLNFLIMIGAMVISVAFHVYYNLTPTMIASFTHPEDISYFTERGHGRIYLHWPSICIGIAVGYFFVNRRQKLHIHWKINVSLWLASLSACLAVLLYPYQWYSGPIPSIGISALYAVGSKLLWASATAWITISCMTGNGGFVNKFLSLPIFVILGRISYMLYLIHPVIHYMYIGSSRVSLRLDPRTIGYMYFGNVFLSVICAFVLTLLFESPFLALERLVSFEKVSEKTKKTKTFDNENDEKDVSITDLNNDKKVT